MTEADDVVNKRVFKNAKIVQDLQRLLNRIHFLDAAESKARMYIGRAKLETAIADVKNYLSKQFPQECFLMEEVKTSIKYQSK